MYIIDLEIANKYLSIYLCTYHTYRRTFPRVSESPKRPLNTQTMPILQQTGMR